MTLSGRKINCPAPERPFMWRFAATDTQKAAEGDPSAALPGLHRSNGMNGVQKRTSLPVSLDS